MNIFGRRISLFRLIKEKKKEEKKEKEKKKKKLGLTGTRQLDVVFKPNVHGQFFLSEPVQKRWHAAPPDDVDNKLA